MEKPKLTDDDIAKMFLLGRMGFPIDLSLIPLDSVYAKIGARILNDAFNREMDSLAEH